MNFLDKVMNWLDKYHCGEVKKVEYGEESLYLIPSHTIKIGVFDDALGDKWFKEYLVDNDCDCSWIDSNVLAFLHEVGHSSTIHQMDSEDIEALSLLKEFIYDEDEPKESMMFYWRLPDEAAANDWEIQFINENPEAVMELMEIFKEA